MRKKLWLLRPLNSTSGPWEPWYDRAFGFVVRAETEQQARELASEDCGQEGPQPWFDDELTVCTTLRLGGKAEVIIADYHAS